VTLDGQPVADAKVTFVPVNEGQGMSATGITDENGAFRLTAAVRGDVAAEPSAGILPGDYYVGVVETISAEKAKQGRVVPKKYNNPKESGLKFTVKEGENTIDIHLASE
jgi:hypothetical protein